MSDKPTMIVNIASLQQEVRDIAQMVILKNRDYGSENILFTDSIGIATRMIDKAYRIANLVKKDGNNHFESLEDSLRDIVGYCLIGLVLYHDAWTDSDTIVKALVDNADAVYLYKVAFHTPYEMSKYLIDKTRLIYQVVTEDRESLAAEYAALITATLNAILFIRNPIRMGKYNTHE